jgi:hypothetical protein
MAQSNPPPSGERTWRDAFGGVVIESRIGRPPGRLGHERREYFPAVEVGLPGWHRAHSQGNATGHESAEGIRYAPPEVNLKFQASVERFISELLRLKGPNVDLRLTTVTYAHSGTRRLKEIQYRVDAVRGGMSRPLFEASIAVENKRDQPRVTTSVNPRTPRELWESYLK